MLTNTDAKSFIDRLVFMYQYAGEDPIFQHIDDTQAFAIRPVKIKMIEALSSQIWPDHKPNHRASRGKKATASAAPKLPKLSEILLLRREVQYTGRGQFVEYNAYFVRDKMEKLDFHLRDKVINLRGLETVTYKGTKPQTGMRPEKRKPPSLTRGSRPVPILKGSLPQDLEIRLPDDGAPGINISSTTHSIKPNGFLLFMNRLLGQSLQWLCSVQNVKQIQRLRTDIGMGPCLLLLGNSCKNEDGKDNKKPWLFLREMDKELGRAKWWRGQVDKISKVQPEEQTSNVQLHHYQQSDGLDMDNLHNPQSNETCELCIKFYSTRECLSFLFLVYEHDLRCK